MDYYLENLLAHWSSTKKVESHYHDERLKTEQLIQEYLQSKAQWKDDGTMYLGDVKIRTQYRRKWNHDELSALKKELSLDVTLFPFLVEYKEVKSHSDYLAEKEPDIWEMIETASILCPAKPYFFIPKKRDKYGSA